MKIDVTEANQKNLYADPDHASARKNDKVRWDNQADTKVTIEFQTWPFTGSKKPIVVPKKSVSPEYQVEKSTGKWPYDMSGREGQSTGNADIDLSGGGLGMDAPPPA